MSSIALEAVLENWSLLEINKLEINGVRFRTITQDGLERLSTLARANAYSFMGLNTIYYVLNHANTEDLNIASILEILAGFKPITPSDESECPNISDAVVLSQTRQCLLNFAEWYGSNAQTVVYNFHDVVAPINPFRNTRFHATLLQQLYNTAYDKIAGITIHNVVQAHHTDLEKLLRLFFIFKHGLVTTEEAEQFRTLASRTDHGFMREVTSSKDGQLSAWYTREVSFCIAKKQLSDGPYADLIFPLIESSPVVLLQQNQLGIDSMLFHPGFVHYVCTVELTCDLRYRQAIIRFLTGRLETIIQSLNVDFVNTTELIRLTGLSEERCQAYLRIVKRRDDQSVNYDIVLSLVNLLIHCYLIIKMLSQPPNTYTTHINVIDEGHTEILYGGLVSSIDAASEILSRARGLLRTFIPVYGQEEFKNLIHPTRKAHTIRYLLGDLMIKWREIIFDFKDRRYNDSDQHPTVAAVEEVVQNIPKTQENLVMACHHYKNMGNMDGLIPYVRESYFPVTFVDEIILPIVSDLLVVTPNILRISGNPRLLDLILACKVLLPTHLRLINILSILNNFLNMTTSYDLNNLVFFNNIIFDLKDVLSDIINDESREILFSDNISNFILQSASRNVFADINNDLDSHVNETVNYFNQHIDVADLLTLIGMCHYDINWYKGTVRVDLGDERVTIGLRPFIDLLKMTLVRYEKSDRYMHNILSNLEESCQKLTAFSNFLQESVDESPGVIFYRQYAASAVGKIYKLKLELESKVNGLGNTHNVTLNIIRKLCTMCTLLSNESIENTNLKICVNTFRRDMLRDYIPIARNPSDELPSFCVERQLDFFHQTFDNTWAPTDFIQMDPEFSETPGARLHRATVPFLNIFDARYALADELIKWNVFTNDEFSAVVDIFLGRTLTQGNDEETDVDPNHLDTITEEDEYDTSISSTPADASLGSNSSRINDLSFLKNAKNLSRPGSSTQLVPGPLIDDQGAPSLTYEYPNLKVKREPNCSTTCTGLATPLIDYNMPTKREPYETPCLSSYGSNVAQPPTVPDRYQSRGRGASAPSVGSSNNTLRDHIQSLISFDDSPPSNTQSSMPRATPATQTTGLSTNYSGSTILYYNDDRQNSQPGSSITTLSHSSRGGSTIQIPSGVCPLTVPSTLSTQQTSLYDRTQTQETESSCVEMASVRSSSQSGGLSDSDILRDTSSSSMSITSYRDRSGSTGARTIHDSGAESSPGSLTPTSNSSGSYIGRKPGQRPRPLSATPVDSGPSTLDDDTSYSAGPLRASTPTSTRASSAASSFIGPPPGRRPRPLSASSVDSGPSGLNLVYSGPLNDNNSRASFRSRSKSVSSPDTVPFDSDVSDRSLTPVKSSTTPQLQQYSDPTTTVRPKQISRPRVSSGRFLSPLDESPSDMVISDTDSNRARTPLPARFSRDRVVSRSSTSSRSGSRQDGRRSVTILDATMSTASESDENSLPLSEIGGDQLADMRKRQGGRQRSSSLGSAQQRFQMAPRNTHQMASLAQVTGRSAGLESPFNLDEFTKFLDEFEIPDTTASTSGRTSVPRSVEMRDASDSTPLNSDDFLSDGRISVASTDSEPPRIRRFSKEYYSLM
ncbi:small tegument protein [Elephant endotheliotropic herpesvirus 5B]|nr:small tegument protein [Elephant endotheliotropic herpesvirus 5B]